MRNNYKIFNLITYFLITILLISNYFAIKINKLPLSGYFISIDYFFIVSGYLFTKILNSTNFLMENIDNFFQKMYSNVLELIFALSIIVLIFLIIGFYYFLPQEFIHFAKSSISSLILVSNLFYHISDIQIGRFPFDNIISEFANYLTPTWIISSLLQIIFFCIILYSVGYKFFKKKLIFFILLIFLIFLFFSDYLSRSRYSINYYLIGRIWEFLLGSLVFFVIHFNLGKNFFDKFFGVLLLSGISIIFFTFNYFNFSFDISLDGLIRTPSLLTLIPVLGFLILVIPLLYRFKNHHEAIEFDYHDKKIRFFGVLFLIHFPIVIFINYLNIELNQVINFILILFCTLLSTGFVLFILHIFNTKTISKLIVILFTFIISYSTIYFEGYKSRVPDFLLTGLTKPWFLLKDNNNNRCFDNINGCSFGNQNKKKIFLIGDSNLGSIALDLKNKLNLKNINYKTYIIGGCTYITNFNRVNRITDKISSKCNDNYFQKIKRDIGTNSIVILGGRMPQWLSGRLFDNMEGGVEIVNGTNEWGGKFVSLNKGLEFDQGFKNSTLELIENNNNVILVYPLPEVGWNVPKKIIELSETKNLIKLKKITLNDESKIPILTTNFDVYLKRSSKSFELYNSIVDKRVFRVYPHEILCNQSIKERCIANDQNYTYYSDDDHPSEVTSNLIAEKIFEKIKLIVTNEKN